MISPEYQAILSEKVVYYSNLIICSAQAPMTQGSIFWLPVPLQPEKHWQTELALSLSSHSLSCTHQWLDQAVNTTLCLSTTCGKMPVSLTLVYQFLKYSPGTLRGPWDSFWDSQGQTYFHAVLRYYLLSFLSLSLQFSRGYIRGTITD